MDISGDAYRTNDLAQLFSFEGRVRRMTFWINALVCGAVSLVMYLICVDVYISPSTLETQVVISNKPFYFFVVLLVAWRSLSVSVRRWHDLDMNGAWAFLSLAPILGMLFPGGTGGLLIQLVLAIATLHAIGMQGYVPGDEDANSYGEAPEEDQWF